MGNNNLLSIIVHFVFSSFETRTLQSAHCCIYWCPLRRLVPLLFAANISPLNARSHDFSPCSTSSLRYRTCCAIALSKVHFSSKLPTVPGRGTGTVSHGRLRFTQLRRPPKHVQPPSKTIEPSPRRDHKEKKWTLHSHSRISAKRMVPNQSSVHKSSH